MKKLTKKQRREIYLRAMDLVFGNSEHKSFTCNAIYYTLSTKRISKFSSSDRDEIVNKDFFPELFLFEPNHTERIPYSYGWFDSPLNYNKKVTKAQRAVTLLLCHYMTKSK